MELKREKERKAKQGKTVDSNSNGVKDEPEERSNRLTTPSDWTTPNTSQTHMSPSHVAPFGSNTTLAPSSLAEAGPSMPAMKNNLLSNGETSDLYGTLSGFSPSSSNGLQHVFGSETTSLEYSILSSMLNGIDPAWLSGSAESAQGAERNLNTVLDADTSNNGPFSHMGIDGMPWQLNENASPWRDPTRAQNGQNLVEPLHHLDPAPISANESTDRLTAFDALEVPSPEGAVDPTGIESNTVKNQVDLQADNVNASSGVKTTTNDQYEKRAAAAIAAATGQDKKPDAVWRERVKHIYGDQMKPFRYTEGYHFLIKYVTAK